MHITLKDLYKTYKAPLTLQEVKAAQGISLEIDDNKIFGIIGKSGAGKSTLVRMISLLERPDKGEVLYDGVRVDSLSGMELLKERRSIGMIFQNFNLFSSRNAIGNVAYPLEIAGTYTKDAIRERTKELLDLVGLSTKEKSPVSALSGGQKQRVAIARALAINPRVLFCDEATSALDPETTHSILELLRDIQRRMNLTIVMITHQLEVVRDACDFVAVLDDGKIVETGETSAIFTSPKSAVTKDFLRHLPLNQDRHDNNGNDKDNIVRWSPEGGAYVLRFIDDATGEPIISRLSRSIDVEVNIRAGGVQTMAHGKVGTMVVDITGEGTSVSRAIEYLKSMGVLVERVGGTL